MRTSVRGILVEDGKLLVIQRIKNRYEYFVIPGGGVEAQETLMQALKRELLEEVGIQIKILDENPFYTYFDQYGYQYFYLISRASDEYGSDKGPEFTSSEYESHGEYKICFVSLQDVALGKINLGPASFKDEFIHNLNKVQDVFYLDSKNNNFQ